MITTRRAVLAGLFLAALALGGWFAVHRGRQAEPQPARVRHPRMEDGRVVVRVLFIGNSLTQWNDLAGMVESLSRASGDGPIVEAESLVAGGVDLGDHWRGDARRRIEQGDWDIVVLQQGPSSLAESRASLLGHARTYDPVIRAAGAKPAFYMVWPEEQHLRSFDRACESYRMAAREIDALLLPAGEAWRAAWRREPEMPLYGPDRFHPSPLGTYLAALVITARLTGRSPLDLADPAGLNPPLEVGDEATPRRLLILKQAAAEAIAREVSEVPGDAPAPPTQPSAGPDVQ
jgi:hypothetical protein